MARRTAERELILDLLPHLPGHFSAEDVLGGVKSSGVSRATVYRTLDFLVARGILQRVHLGEPGARYEVIAGRDQHAHLLCLGCGELTDYPLPLLQRLPAAVRRRQGFAVEHLLVRLCGYCHKCRAKQSKGFSTKNKNPNKRRMSHGKSST